MAVVFNDVSYLDKVKDLSFIVRDNKITSIVGPSGSGKSTIVDLLAGLVFPQYGSVSYDINSNDIGVLYQDTLEQFFYNNIKEEFVFVLKMHHVRDISKKILQSLKLVGLGVSVLEKSPYNLSLSERKKVSLALALSFNPKLIILDEPVFGLDGKDRTNLIRLIRMMKKKYGKTIIILTKDVDLALEISDDVILINNGEILSTGDKYDILTDEKLLVKSNLPLPKVIAFSKLVKNMKKINLGFRDDINDLVKDIYRNLR